MEQRAVAEATPAPEHSAGLPFAPRTRMAIILFMGAVSGAHLNPAMPLAFALRRDFPWKRVPGYIGDRVAIAAGGTGPITAESGM